MSKINSRFHKAYLTALLLLIVLVFAGSATAADEADWVDIPSQIVATEPNAILPVAGTVPSVSFWTTTSSTWIWPGIFRTIFSNLIFYIK